MMQLSELYRLVTSTEPGPAWLPALRGAARGASWLYGLGVWGRNLAYDLGLARVRYLPVPVLGVGNLSVGGTGKTPLVMAVVRALQELGLPSAVISRGYGGQTGQGDRGVTWVSRGDGPLVGAAQAGDEPVLLARRLKVPVAVGPHRHAVGREVLARCGPRVLVGDDLFQHRGLHRDLDLVALDASQPLADGFLLPRGRLREPAAGLRRAQAVVLTHAEDPDKVRQAKVWLHSFWGPGPVLACRHVVDRLTDQDGQALAPGQWQGQPVLAFCGLGRPEGFARSLHQLGLEVRGLQSFADHHPFSMEEVNGLWERARALGAQALVTSQKDEVRLPPVLPPGLRLWVTDLELEFAPDQPSLKDVLLWGLGPWRRAQ